MINSSAHRDYFLDGTQIQVDMFKDRNENVNYNHTPINSKANHHNPDTFSKLSMYIHTRMHLRILLGIWLSSI